jgi:hypothetical protein
MRANQLLASQKKSNRGENESDESEMSDSSHVSEKTPVHPQINNLKVILNFEDFGHSVKCGGPMQNLVQNSAGKLPSFPNFETQVQAKQAVWGTAIQNQMREELNEPRPRFNFWQSHPPTSQIL